MTTFAVATAHSLVLTVSHDLLFRQPLDCGGTRGRRFTARSLSLGLRFNPTHESGQSSCSVLS
jgi:hypothetical protein